MDGRRELGLLVEPTATQDVAFEVTATASPGPGDARHLARMRDRLEVSFLAGADRPPSPSRHILGRRLLDLPIAHILAEG